MSHTSVFRVFRQAWFDLQTLQEFPTMVFSSLGSHMAVKGGNNLTLYPSKPSWRCLAANPRNLLTGRIKKDGTSWGGRGVSITRLSWFCHGAGGWRSRSLDCSQPWDPHICACKRCDDEIILLLPQASQPQIPLIRSHFFYMILARKHIL